MNKQVSYWNPYLEVLPRERLEALQLKKFKRILTWAYSNSRFHRALYQQAGMHPEDINSWEDIRRVPKVEKAMMKPIQRKDPFPYGDALCVDLDDVCVFRQTSGTTGQPIYQADTWQDWEWWTECWATLLWAQGYRPHDRVFLPFGYNVFVAFWAAHYASEKIGCETVPGGVLDTKSRILKIQELQATAMMATPTYVLGMADTARNQLHIDPATLPITKITCAGEPGALIPSTKQRIEEIWGSKVFDHAGATEIGAWGFECSCQPGALHVNEAMFLAEVEDLETGELLTETGQKGKLVITALDRFAQPCVRFDAKDIVEIGDEQCECGRTYKLFKGGVIGRADDITKVKGVLLAPSAIEDVVRSIQGLGNEYEVIVDKKGDTDTITLKVELTEEAANSSTKELQGELTTQLRLKTNLGYNLEILPPNSLPRYEVKARRFKDLRKKGI
ncbi:phenylacetate--CoA ligase family protein [Desulfomonile tiedjei]|uniref:Coenzyme F390 synthetase n=1 Tax=Desulfomonile tiedjei (strain ATCC 49306 / DSM 6799 / DCB-1) TaxID=706587 RepID=I4CC84_DESTA|nr:AMP-binding protein [Desulfomonile tiedjei]AFM27175.1 coenzyme F390 synthetase [Desulfomonile tiedjei DSM 6799]